MNNAIQQQINMILQYQQGIAKKLEVTIEEKKEVKKEVKKEEDQFADTGKVVDPFTNNDPFADVPPAKDPFAEDPFAADPNQKASDELDALLA